MIRYLLAGCSFLYAWEFFWVAYSYHKGWKAGLAEGKQVGYEEGVRDGFREGRDSKEQGWWDQAEAEVDQERVKIWRESGAA